MPGVSIDDFGASFIHYLPGVIEILNNTSKARLLSTGKIKWEGVHLEKSVHVRRNVAINSVQDGGAIPPAGKQSYVPAKAFRKNLVGSVKVTDGLLNNAATTKHAAITVLESELRGLLDTIRKWENYMYTRDGTGEVAKLGTTVSGTTITTTDGRLMWEGAYFDILDAGDLTTVHATFKVEKIARAFTSGEVTITPESTIASNGQAQNDLIIWRGSTPAGQSAYNNVAIGLGALIDDSTGTFQSVDVTTYNRYTSPVLANGGTKRPLVPDLFRRALTAIKQESGEAPKNGITCLTNNWGANSFEEMYEGQLRITETTKVAGIEMASFQSTAGKVNIVSDDDSPYNQMFFFDGGEITRGSQKELDWRREGSGLFKRSDDNLTWTATCLDTHEYFIERRNRCSRLDDLLETKDTAFG